MKMLSLRQFSDEDLSIFKQWLYEPHVAKWYEHPLNWIYELQNRKNEFAFIHHFIIEYAGEAIGFCQYYEYSYGGEDWHGTIDIEGTYSIDYLIGDVKYLGKGFGTSTVQCLIDEIKKQHNAKCIIVQPDSKNKASCNTLLSCGFEYDQTNELYIIKIK